MKTAVQSLWLGSDLSTIQHMCFNSFRQHGYGFVLYIYDEIKGLPEGVDLQDASAILPKRMVDRFTWEGSVAPFSDLFRYKLLHERGGIWVDTDVICLNPLPQADYFFFDSSLPHIRQPDSPLKGAHYVNNWFITAPKNCELMGDCVERVLAAGKAEAFDDFFFVFQDAVAARGLERYASGAFLPINWNSLDLYRKASPQSQQLWQTYRPLSHVAHLCNHMWILDGIDPDTGFEGGSIYAHLRETYSWKDAQA